MLSISAKHLSIYLQAVNLFSKCFKYLGRTVSIFFKKKKVEALQQCIVVNEYFGLLYILNTRCIIFITSLYLILKNHVNCTMTLAQINQWVYIQLNNTLFSQLEEKYVIHIVCNSVIYFSFLSIVLWNHQATHMCLSMHPIILLILKVGTTTAIHLYLLILDLIGINLDEV